MRFIFHGYEILSVSRSLPSVLPSFFSAASVPLQPARRCIIRGGETLPRSAFEVDVSSGHIFVTCPRPESSFPEAIPVNLREAVSFDPMLLP
jgi:hypothetical protein